MSEQKRRQQTQMVPYPSRSFVPERDLGSMPVLECSHLGIEFGGLKAVDDFSVVMGRTEIGGLIGPNGAGKTTVFNLLTKVYQPTHGTMMLEGKDMGSMTTVDVSKAGIARTFQNIRLFNNMTVEENVRIGLHNQIRCGMFSGILRLPKYWKAEKAQHEKTLELLNIFDMAGMADERAGSLPYGAQRRTAEHLRYGRHGGRAGGQPALRRAAPAGDRPCAGDEPEAPAAGRAGGGHEPA